MDNNKRSDKSESRAKELQVKLQQMERIRESILQNRSAQNDERIQFLLRRL
jgi:hypothetical protein